LKDVEVAGSLPVISVTAEAQEEYTLRSLTGEPPLVLKDMKFFWSLFSGILPSLMVVSVRVVGRVLETCVAFFIPYTYYYQWPC